MSVDHGHTGDPAASTGVVLTGRLVYGPGCPDLVLAERVLLEGSWPEGMTRFFVKRSVTVARRSDGAELVKEITVEIEADTYADAFDRAPALIEEAEERTRKDAKSKIIQQQILDNGRRGLH